METFNDRSRSLKLKVFERSTSSGRARELAGSAAGVVWVQATALYALAQAAAGFALTPLFAHTGSHASVFVPGLAVSIAALLLLIPDR